jgi:GrpB-like predicted nucleotidyltransferase (UPF0157 family)
MPVSGLPVNPDILTIALLVPELDEVIHLSPHDPQWSTLFEAEAQRLSCSLPGGVSLEHIGSTSVPGLLAKPIIDIMVGAEAHHSIEAIRKVLVQLGYEDLGEAGVAGRIYLRRRIGAAFNIALVRRGGPLWISNLAFRNYLRRNAEARREYAQTKLEAFNTGIRSLLAYSDYKSRP